MEIRALGGVAFAQAVEHFHRGGTVSYRGMELMLRRAEFVCSIPFTEPPATLTDRRALEALTRARFRVGALLASAPALAAAVGNREPRLVIVADGGDAAELFELRGDRMRRL